MHPLAWPANQSGAMGMKAGDAILYEGRSGIVDEFLSDGDAYVTWDDGTFGTVKWFHLDPVEAAPETGMEKNDAS